MTKAISQALVVAAAIALVHCSGTNLKGDSNQSKGNGGADGVDAGGGPDTEDTDQENGATEADGSDAGTGSGADAGGDGSIDADGDGDPKTVNGILIEDGESVAEACAKGKAVEQVVEVVFEDNTGECGWGKDGNLADQAKSTITARKEQRVSAQLPKNALVCEMAFDFPDQDVHYDDHIVLAFNDSVLFSNLDFPKRASLEEKDGLFLYSWDKIKGFKWDKDDQAGNTDQYCLGTCNVPPTDTDGKFELEIEKATSQKISAAVFKAQKAEFLFVTTGDDDPDKDCRHVPIKFNFKAMLLK